MSDFDVILYNLKELLIPGDRFEILQMSIGGFMEGCRIGDIVKFQEIGKARGEPIIRVHIPSTLSSIPFLYFKLKLISSDPIRNQKYEDLKTLNYILSI